MRIESDQLWLSPSDLSSYLACGHLSSLQLQVAQKLRSKPHSRDELSELVAEKGNQHEAAFLDQLVADGRQITEIPTDVSFEVAAAATVDAMRAGADVIYQATSPAMAGGAVPTSSFASTSRPISGSWSYEPGHEARAFSQAFSGVAAHLLLAERSRSCRASCPSWMYVVPGTGVLEWFRPGTSTRFCALLRLACALTSPRRFWMSRRGRRTTVRGASSSRSAASAGRTRTT